MFSTISVKRLAKVEFPTLQSGPPTGSALRISIYTLNNEVKNFKTEQTKAPNIFKKNNGQIELVCGEAKSGAIASYLWHNYYGKFAFIAVKLTTGKELATYGKTHEDFRTVVITAIKSV